MATYFIDPYKKYNKELAKIGNLSGSISALSGKLNGVGIELSGLKSKLSGSNWREQGINQLNDDVFPMLENSVSTFMNNISTNMAEIASNAVNLYNETEKLRNEDEKYESYKVELNNLVVCLRYDEDGYPNPEYYSYLNKKNQLENNINTSKIYCETYKRNCDSIVNRIKSLDGSLNDFKTSFVDLRAIKDNSVSILQSVNNGKMLRVKFRGNEFYIANSSINCVDYAKYIQQYNLCQEGGICPADCMLLSQYYAMDMMRGTYTSGESMANGKGSPATRIGAYIESKNKDDILRYIYNESLSGRPTVLQVTQVNSSNGYRHLVTVVGFAASVKSYKDLNPDTIFVLDCYDGKLQTLSQARSEGGHERSLYASEGYYFVRGATEEFKAQEVYNDEWKASNADNS